AGSGRGGHDEGTDPVAHQVPHRLHRRPRRGGGRRLDGGRAARDRHGSSFPAGSCVHGSRSGSTSGNRSSSESTNAIRAPGAGSFPSACSWDRLAPATTISSTTPPPSTPRISTRTPVSSEIGRAHV